MKIWFDLSNSPHINLFAGMIRDLMKDYKVIITCRPLANTIDLLDLHGFSYKVVGKHYGGKVFYKLFGYPIRVWQLYFYLKKQKPDFAISQSSFHSPLTAWLLRIPSIYMNDNEHAIGNIPSFIFSKRILIPEFLDKKKVIKQFARENKIIQYPGVKEGIYLWNAEIKKEKTKDRYVYIRPEPWVAQYYKGALNFMDDLILFLKDKVKIVLLPRGRDQAIHYHGNKFDGIIVQEKPLSLTDVVKNCSLFIGAGGTMTREMAVLGIPTISVYQDELLDVDRYLIKIGAMIHKPDLDGKYALNYLEKSEQSPPNNELLIKGEKAYNLIKSYIENKLNN